MILIHHPDVDQFIQALCWTLIHSLWQGLGIAVLAAVVLTSTRKSTPVFRYNLLAILLVVFISGSAYTLWYTMDRLGEVVPHPAVSGPLISDSTQLVFGNNHTAEQTWNYRQVISFLDANATLVVGIWLVIFLFRFARVVGGMVLVKRIRTKGVHQVEEKWQWQLRQLAQKIDLYERIVLMASERVRVPMVIGYLTPMIVVPVGFLSEMPLAQVEAILLHELAHIKRQDYLVNLLQSFAETLFFFNPALLWLSSLIREEREHSCDDLAISVLKDKSSFVNALVSFQEYHLEQTSVAVAFAGTKNHLLERVKRIVYKNNKQLNAMEKLFIAAGCLVALGLTATISVSSSKEPTPPKVALKATELAFVNAPVQSEPVSRIRDIVRLDTLPATSPHRVESGEGVSNMQFTRDGHRYEIVADNGEVVYFKVDGKRIPKEGIGKYNKEIQQFSEEIKYSRIHAEQARKEGEEMREKAKVQRAEADKMRHQADQLRKPAEEFKYKADKTHNENFNYSRNIDKLAEEARELREHANQIRNQTAEVRSQAEKMRMDAGQQRNIMEIRNEVQKLRKVEAELMREQAELARIDANALRIETGKLREQAQVYREEAGVMREKAEKMRAEYEKLQEDFISELVAERVISTREGLSYKLDKNELIVNGKKQPDAFHKRMKERFIKTDDVQMVYNWQGRTGYTTSGLIYSK